MVSGAFDIGSAADRTSFPAWRYAIANAVATAPDAPTRERLLSGVARSNPAALSWILDEIEPGPHSRPDRASGPAGDAGKTPNDQDADASADASIAAGVALRAAFEALVDGFGPLATTVAVHRDGRLTQWGSAVADGWMTLAIHREATEPAVVALPQDHMGQKPLTLGWIFSTLFKAPAGDFGHWHRAVS